MPDGILRRMVGRRSLFRSTAGIAAAASFLTKMPPAAGEAAVDDAGALHLGPRIILVPKSISLEAQKFLSARSAPTLAAMSQEPPVTDVAAWKKRIEAVNASLEPMIARMRAAPAKVERKTLGGVNVAIGTPDVMRHPDRLRLSIHGGSWIYLGGAFVTADAGQVAAQGGCMAVSVDYRMAPDFPFPAALDDCVAVYRELVKTHDPKKIVISGGSAGGNLSAAVTLKIRDLGLPLPGAVGMMTPVTDCTQSSDTLQTNYGVDVVLSTSDKPSSRSIGVAVYAPGHDPRDPYLSPVFGDFTKGFPPTFLQSGTRDLLLSDTVRMHRALLKAGIEAELHVWEAMPHGGFGFTAPEDDEVRDQFLKFIDKHIA